MLTKGDDYPIYQTPEPKLSYGASLNYECNGASSLNALNYPSPLAFAFFIGQILKYHGLLVHLVNWHRNSKFLGVSSPDALAQKFYGATDGRVIDRFDIATGATPGGTFAIAERSYAATPVRGDKAHVDAFVATVGDDMITGTSGHDIIIGNSDIGLNRRRRAAAASNDNQKSGWCGAAFRFAQREMAA